LIRYRMPGLLLMVLSALAILYSRKVNSLSDPSN
jgi:hypothetical protein